MSIRQALRIAGIWFLLLLGMFFLVLLGKKFYSNAWFEGLYNIEPVGNYAFFQSGTLKHLSRAQTLTLTEQEAPCYVKIEKGWERKIGVRGCDYPEITPGDVIDNLVNHGFLIEGWNDFGGILYQEDQKRYDREVQEANDDFIKKIIILIGGGWLIGILWTAREALGTLFLFAVFLILLPFKWALNGIRRVKNSIINASTDIFTRFGYLGIILAIAGISVILSVVF